ncbi:hypothetical protein [Kiloniella sp.]|uniref:hypothetical protein n=1 Tax=Kiloniella sp. TaxID=1938587 RepID=UPI003B025E1E
MSFNDSKIITAIASLSLALGLSGCLVSEEARIADKDYDLKLHTIESSGASIVLPEVVVQKPQAVHVKDRPWLGLKKLSLPKGTALPEQFRTGNGIAIPFEEALDINEIANRISAATGISVKLKGQQDTEGDEKKAKTFTPVSYISSASSDKIIWQGPLDSLLDQWTSFYGYDWSYDGDSISIIRYGASVFTIDALAGDDTFTTSLSSSAETDGSNSLASQKISSTYVIDLFNEVETQAKELVSAKTKVKASPTSGTITVKGIPADIKTVANFLQHLNKKILRSVTLSVRILDLQRTRSADYNFDLDFLLKDILGKQSLQFVSGGTSNLIGTVRPLPSGTTTNSVNATIKALNSLGTISRDLNGTVAALNGQPVPLQRFVRRAYLKSAETDTIDGVVSRSFTIGSVDSGYFISFLPRIVNDDQVRVRMNIGLQDLLELREFTSDGTTLQFPEESSNAIRIERLIRSGDTLIISGTTDNKTNGDRSGLGNADNWLLGGNQDADISRNQQVILLSAEIDPPQGVTEYKADLL